MNFNYDDSQQILKESARKFLKQESPISHIRNMLDDKLGFSRDVYKKMADLEWTALMIPEEYGGLEQSLVDFMVIQEEIGRALTPEPLFSTIVLGALPVMYGGSDALKKEILPKVADGSMLMTMALTEEKFTYEPFDIDMKAEKDGSGYVLSGTKMFVPDAHVADKMVVVARTKEDSDRKKGLTLFIVDQKDGKAEGIQSTELKSLDSRKRFKLVFDKVAVSEANIIGKVDEAWPILDRVIGEATAALSAEMVGGAEYIIEMTAEYAKTRIAFGVPIGSLQAVQHKAADMLVAKECAKSSTYYACMALAEGRDDAPFAVSAAKAWASDAYIRATADGIQLHGGIGFTWEHDIHLYYKRAKATEVTFGDANYHRELAAQILEL